MSVAAPASGTYGEKQDLVDLKNELPVGAVGGPPPPSPPTPPSPNPIEPPQAVTTGRPAGARPPGGVPSALLHPTTRPDVPVSTPLAPQVGTPAVADPRQGRLAILDALSTDPNVAPETREWAQSVIEALIGG